MKAFIVVMLASWAVLSVRATFEEVTCSSESGKEFPEICSLQESRTYGKKVILVDELTDTNGQACQEGSTYGLTMDQTAVWTYGGCAGLFNVSTDRTIMSICSGDGERVKQFNDRKEQVAMPCKYIAVDAECGSYSVRVSPGSIWFFPNFQLDTIWLSVEEINSNGFWEGRTSNKLSAKYLKGKSTAPFNKKGGNLTTESLLKFGKIKPTGEVYAELTNVFRLSFQPWDPDSEQVSKSQWKFECFDENFQPPNYPQQLCGNSDKQAVTKRMQELGLQDRIQTVMYDILAEPPKTIAHVNPQCINATEILSKNTTTSEQKLTAIRTCNQILSSHKHSKCVAKYACNPMDVFLECITWVLTGFDATHISCENTAQGIDYCRNFSRNSNHLSTKIQDANCLKDFITLG